MALIEVDKQGRVVRQETIEESEEWEPSLGADVTKRHYRDGRRHAECDGELCTLHEDEHPPSQLAEHLLTSTPGETVVGAGAATLTYNKTGDPVKSAAAGLAAYLLAHQAKQLFLEN